MTSIKNTLSRAKELLGERGWSKGQYVDGDGCLCALGAIYVAAGELASAPLDKYAPYYAPGDAGDQASKLYLEASEHLGSVVPRSSGWPHVHLFNDLPSTTQDDVLAMFDRGIEAAE